MNLVRLSATLLLAALPVAADDPAPLPVELLSCNERTLLCGNDADSTLPSAGCSTACGEEAELWKFRVFVQTSLVTLTATSSDFDSRIELLDGDGRFLAANDDAGGSRNARLGVVLEPGSYFARVVAKPAGARGAYRISLHCLLSDTKNFCVPNDTTICLAGRFSFRVGARLAPGGTTIAATARTQSELHGFFSVPELTGNPDNPEVAIKLIDGRAVNGRWWVFWGGLTGLDYELTVRDSFTRTEKTYRGQGVDTESFADP